jgi:hypothetical protein
MISAAINRAFKLMRKITASFTTDSPKTNAKRFTLVPSSCIQMKNYVTAACQFQNTSKLNMVLFRMMRKT